MTSALDYAKQNADAFVGQLKDLLRIPSISTDSAYDADTRRAADWVADDLRNIGIPTVEVMETDGHPIVYAEMGDDPGKPTVLVYGHYDVQPPDPLE
ncbi:MAG: peptidase M20, partial [Bacteroidetes bacterium]|nr:peptidase M20 [Bacteroidota bacterium]